MEPDLIWWGIALATGPLAGLLVAKASLVLPGEPPVFSQRRYLIAAALCTLAAFWSVLIAPPPVGLVGAVLGWQLVLLAFVDAEHLWLPHRLTVPLGLMGLAEAAAFAPDQLVHRLIGAVVGFGALALIAWAYQRVRDREGMGGGDFRLLAAAGAWVGWIGIPSVLVIACLAGLAVVGLRAVSGRPVSRAEEIPFGVFLAIGLWLTWLYGPLGRAGGSTFN